MPVSGQQAAISWLIAGCTFIGALAVRLATALSVYRWVDSDQAVLGLMVRHILHGDRPLFFNGQPYNAAIEAYLTTPIVAWWGSTDLTIRLVPITLSAAFAALCAVIALRLAGPLVGALTGAYLASGPPLLLLWTTAAGAGYVEVLVLGTLALLLFGDAPWPAARWPLWGAILGFCTGLGLWADPLIVPYLLTLLIVAIPALLRRRLRPSAAALLAFWATALAGLAPVLVGTGVQGLVSLVGLGTGVPQSGNWLLIRLGILHRLVLESGPVLLGFAHPSVEIAVFRAGVATHWIPYAVGVILTLALAARLAWGGAHLPATVRRILAGSAGLADNLAVLGLVSIGLFLVSHYGSLAWTTRVPRYLLPIYTTTGLVVAWVLPGWHHATRPLPPTYAGWGAAVADSTRPSSWWGRHRRPVACFAVGAMIAVNISALSRESPALDVRPLVKIVRDSGAEAVFADYWLCQRLTFESGERLIGISIGSDLLLGINRNRYAPYLRRALNTQRVAWVVPLGHEEGVLRHLLVAHHVHARRASWGPFAVYTDLSPALRPANLTRSMIRP